MTVWSTQVEARIEVDGALIGALMVALAAAFASRSRLSRWARGGS